MQDERENWRFWLARQLRNLEQLTDEEAISVVVYHPMIKDYLFLRQRPAPQWRPSAEAPRDGTHILACNALMPYSATWTFDQRPPYVVHWWDNPDEEGFYLSSGDNGGGAVPTHFMPLPMPIRFTPTDTSASVSFIGAGAPKQMEVLMSKPFVTSRIERFPRWNSAMVTVELCWFEDDGPVRRKILQQYETASRGAAASARKAVAKERAAVSAGA